MLSHLPLNFELVSLELSTAPGIPADRLDFWGAVANFWGGDPPPSKMGLLETLDAID